jgi:hypothetical protein
MPTLLPGPMPLTKAELDEVSGVPSSSCIRPAPSVGSPSGIRPPPSEARAGAERRPASGRAARPPNGVYVKFREAFA